MSFSSTLLDISWRIANNAILVLPAPVGAHTKRFSSVKNAFGYIYDWITFRLFVPSNAFLAHSGRSYIGMSLSSFIGFLGNGSILIYKYSNLSVLVDVGKYLTKVYCSIFAY